MEFEDEVQKAFDFAYSRSTIFSVLADFKFIKKLNHSENDETSETQSHSSGDRESLCVEDLLIPPNTSQISSTFSTSSAHSGSSIQFDDEDIAIKSRRLLDFLCANDIIFPFLQVILVRDQAQVASSGHLFREDFGIGTYLLQKLWIENEGVEFINSVVRSLVDDVYLLPYALELDPARLKKGSTSKNKRTLIKLLSKFVDNVINNFEKLVSRNMLDLFRHLNSTFAPLFPDFKLDSVIFLRLICPVIISPHKFIQSFHIAPELHTLRTLVIVSKVIQRIANHILFEGALEAHMKPLNPFISSYLPKWINFFQNIFGQPSGSFFRNSGDISSVDQEVSSVIARSNQSNDLDTEVSDRKSDLLLEIKADLLELLLIERRPKWTTLRSENSNMSYIARDTVGEPRMLFKIVSDTLPVNYSVVYEWVKKYVATNEFDKHIEDSTIIEQISSDFKIVRNQFTLLFAKKETLSLVYTQSAPEHRFGISILKSINLANVPPIYPRVEAFSGFIVRGISPTETTLSYLIRVDNSHKILEFLPKRLFSTALRKTFHHFNDVFRKCMTPTTS